MLIVLFHYLAVDKEFLGEFVAMGTWVTKSTILLDCYHLVVEFGGFQIHAAIIQYSDLELTECSTIALHKIRIYMF